jgi:hypothetical protein
VSYNLIAVTNGATYSSGWKTWALNAGFDGNTFTGNWADSWRVGFDNVAVYLAGNLFDPTSGSFQYAKIRVLMKSDLYNQATTTLPYKDIFQLVNANGTLVDSLMPVHQRGKPSAVNSQLLVNSTTFNLPATYLTVWKIADPAANPVVANASTITGLLSYNFPHPAPQLGSGVTVPALLDSGDSRMLKAVYRNGFLYTARDTGYTDVTGAATTVTYDVVDTTLMKLSSQARLLNTNSFYPAFDVPATVPSGSQYAAASGTACPWCITGTTTDSSGNATYASISSLKPGKDFYDVNSNSTAPNRWGDYFGGAVDPISGGLWAAGQYAETRQAQCPGNPQGCPVGIAGVWGTWVGYFPWQTVSTFSDVSPPLADYANVMSLWGVTSGCTSTTFCPNNVITRWQFAIFLIGAMEGKPCPNNTPCGAAGFTWTPTPYFTDVPATDPGFPFVQKLRDLGITSGCTATSFCPNDMVPRWEAAVMIVRGKMKALFGDTFTYPPTAFFTDVPAATSGMFPFVQKMAELGITAGCTATQFCPNSAITRIQAAIFIVRGFLN